MTEIGYHHDAYLSTPLEEKLAWVQGQPGQAAIAPASDFMGVASKLYTDSDAQVQQTMRTLGSGWSGDAADNASRTLQDAADWSQGAGTSTQYGGQNVDGYGRSFESLRGQVHYEPGGWTGGDTVAATVAAVTANPAALGVKLITDYFQTVQQNRTNDAAAVRALQAHEDETRTAVAAFPSIPPAPLLPPTPPGPGDGGGRGTHQKVPPLPTPPGPPVTISPAQTGGAGAGSGTAGTVFTPPAGLPPGAGPDGPTSDGQAALPTTGAGVPPGPGRLPGAAVSPAVNAPGATGGPIGPFGPIGGAGGVGSDGTAGGGATGRGPGGGSGTSSGAGTLGTGGIGGRGPGGIGGLGSGGIGGLDPGEVGGLRPGGVGSGGLGGVGSGGLGGSSGLGAEDGVGVRTPFGATPRGTPGGDPAGLGVLRGGPGGELGTGSPLGRGVGGTEAGWRDLTARAPGEGSLISRGPAAGAQFAERLPTGAATAAEGIPPRGGPGTAMGTPFIGGAGGGGGSRSTEHRTEYWVRSAEPFDVPLPPHGDGVLHGGTR